MILRRAESSDLDFLVELYADEDVRPFLAGGIAVHPSFRGRRVADDAARLLQRRLIGERGFHRLQLEVYGFNERAMRHAERAGFVREGVKRKAYLRDGDWVDGVLYGLIAEDLQPRNDSSSAPA